MHASTHDGAAGALTRLLLVEPVNLVRSCLQALLGRMHDVELSGAVATIREGMAIAEALAPDLMLVDMNALLAGGPEGLRQIRERCPATRLLLLIAGNTAEAIQQAFCAGADGYVNIGATLEELGSAIRLTMTAGKQQDRRPAVPAAAVRQRYGLQPARPDTRARLTVRESEVLKLIASGRSNKAIAAHLCLSLSTIERHRTNLIRKLDLHNAAALTAYAIRSGLVAINGTTPGQLCGSSWLN